jgi:hypothetical protein
MWSRIEKVRARLLQWLHWVNPDDILVMTLTFKDRQISAAEAQKRFHSLWSNLFSKKVGGRYFCVLQYQRVRWWVGEHYGTPHYHLIIVWPGIRKGCLYHGDGIWTPGRELERLELLFQQKYEQYGFGPQHRFEPMRNDYPVKAAVSYIVGYLQKGLKDAVARPLYRLTELGEDGVESRYVSAWEREFCPEAKRVIPRSYRFGRGVVRVGHSETTLRGGWKKRDMIRCYCQEYQIDFEDFGFQVDILYPDIRSLGWATKLFWRDRVVPLWKMRQVTPF